MASTLPGKTCPSDVIDRAGRFGPCCITPAAGVLVRLRMTWWVSVYAFCIVIAENAASNGDIRRTNSYDGSTQCTCASASVYLMTLSRWRLSFLSGALLDGACLLAMCAMDTL